MGNTLLRVLRAFALSYLIAYAFLSAWVVARALYILFVKLA